MFRFTIRDVLWLMVVVALTVSWWVDSRRIDKGVADLAKQQRLLQEDFDDRLKIVDALQKEANSRLLGGGRIGRTTSN